MAYNANKDLKLFYSISEVAKMFDVNESLLRYWEKEFPIISPKKAGHSRQYRKEDIENATFEYELEELVASGSQTLKIEIEGSDIKDKILGAYPFAPEITVELTGEKEKDSGDDKYYVKIPREAELSADLRFSAGASINGVYDFTKGTFEIVEGN